MGCCESRDKATNEQKDATTVDLNTSKGKSGKEQQDQDQVATQAQDEAEIIQQEELSQEQEPEEDFDATELTVNVQEQKFDEADQISEHLEKYRGRSHEVIVINLSGNSYSLDAAKKVAEFFWEVNNCERALLNNMFVSRERHELPQALQEMMNALTDKPIFQLNLSDNAFGPDGVNAFKDFLLESQTLTQLSLNNCGLGPEGAQILSDALIQRGEFSLTHLDLGRNRMKSEGGQHIATYLDTFETLESFNIAANSIEQEGLIPLFESLLKHKDHIKVLEINDNSILGKSFKGLIQLIKSCEVIETLDISDSNINKRRKQRKLINVLDNSAIRNTIADFKWNNDIEPYQVSMELLNSLLEYPENLVNVQAVGLIKKRSNRLEIREKFEARNTEIKLTEREIVPQSDSEDSDSFSEDEENSQESSASSSSSESEKE